MEGRDGQERGTRERGNGIDFATYADSLCSGHQQQQKRPNIANWTGSYKQDCDWATTRRCLLRLVVISNRRYLRTRSNSEIQPWVPATKSDQSSNPCLACFTGRILDPQAPGNVDLSQPASGAPEVAKCSQRRAGKCGACCDYVSSSKGDHIIKKATDNFDPEEERLVGGWDAPESYSKMDTGRFSLHQPGWDTSSAVEGNGLQYKQNISRNGAYGGRKLVEPNFHQETVFEHSQEPVFERELYGSSVEFPPCTSEEEVAVMRDSQRGHQVFDVADNSGDYRYERDSITRHTEYSSNDRDLNHRYYQDEFSSRHSERERYWRDRDWHRSERDQGRSRSRSRSRSRNRGRSPVRDRQRHRSNSAGYDELHSPLGDDREERYDDYANVQSERKRNSESNGYEFYALAPSATIVVKGLSQKTREEDLYQAFAKWGPLEHVRVIKERNSGVSRGFAFVDFPSVDAAQAMMDQAEDGGVILDGRRLIFEYSKPMGPGGPVASRQIPGRGCGYGVDDWICTICGCANFARRVLCFQCNEKRTEDAPIADVPISAGRKQFEPGPTHVLVVRSLDDNVDEEMLYNEFSKHALVKELRLVRDKQTRVSRGFAFLHFNSIDDSTRALNATNGSILKKNGQILRVSFAKSVHGSGAPQASGLAAAAIEAAACAQQYGSGAWAPKEYNPEEEEIGKSSSHEASQTAAESGFTWDEASGYYYDAASGFYYDGTRGLYYDGNAGIWYTYNQETQEYVPYADPPAAGDENVAVSTEGSRNDDISSPACPTQQDNEVPFDQKRPTLAESVAAAALAAQATLRKAKEREKDLRLPGKNLGKKKISDAVNLWKQRQHEANAPAQNVTKVATAEAPAKTASGRLSGGGNHFGVDYQPHGMISSRQLNSHAEPGIGGTGETKSELNIRTSPAPVRPDMSATVLSRSSGSVARTRRRFTEAPPPHRDKAATTLTSG